MKWILKLKKKCHKVKSLEQKEKEAKEYAKKHSLKITKKYLFAFRNHDKNGSGVFNKIIRYEKGEYYRDWHCDMDEEIKDSFGLGIWPDGNTKVKVKIEDWGCEVKENNGKGRVWGFEIV